MTTRSNGGWFVAALGLVVVLAPDARADDKKADVTGTWKWTVERNGNTIETTLKLKQDGEKLTGTISGRQGSNDIEIEDGKVKGDAVSFKVTRMFGEQQGRDEVPGQAERRLDQGGHEVRAGRSGADPRVGGEARQVTDRI